MLMIMIGSIYLSPILLCTHFFSNIYSFQRLVLRCPFYRWGKTGSVRFKNWSKFTLLISHWNYD